VTQPDVQAAGNRAAAVAAGQDQRSDRPRDRRIECSPGRSAARISGNLRAIWVESPNFCCDREEAPRMTRRQDASPVEAPIQWHTLPTAQVAQMLQTGVRGLSEADARHR